MTYCEACETDGPCKRGDCAVGAKVPTDLAKLRVLLEKIEPGLWEQDGFTVSYPCENGESAFRMFKPEGAAMVAMMNEAPALLDEVEKLRAALRHAIATLERDGDEWGICGDLRQALGSAK